MTLATDGSTPPGGGDKRTDELIAVASSKDEAEAMRRIVSRVGTRLWVFVYPHSDGKFSITACNEWGGALAADVIAIAKQACDDYVTSLIEEISIDELVPDEEEPDTERVPKLLS